MSHVISKEQYKSMKREGDGICKMCLQIAMSTAEPLAENIYCQNCDNRAVVGIDKGIELRLVTVLHRM